MYTLLRKLWYLYLKLRSLRQRAAKLNSFDEFVVQAMTNNFENEFGHKAIIVNGFI